ncbi:Zinc finger GRF-type protein [Arachis hypogaea]|nr:Zinc finger GRF-type protein [Arachis hypogaea]
MLGSSSQGLGSSSRARSHGGWVKNAHRDKGDRGDRGGKVPHWCGCGLRPILRWFGTDSNPERPFCGCSNYNTDVEEEEAIVGRNESSVSEDH